MSDTPKFQEGKKGERNWYAVHTYSGYEEAVVRYLKQRVDSLSMNDKIFEVIVPKQKKIQVKNGRRQVVEEKIYPGYVLVDMVLTEDSWYVVRNTPRVTGFVGSDNTTPSPLAAEEVTALLHPEGHQDNNTTYKMDLRMGDLVRINDGPFKDYEGKISEVDEERGRIKVLVPIFGRETGVELDSLQVHKI